jgi:hypothetical protein
MEPRLRSDIVVLNKVKAVVKNATSEEVVLKEEFHRNYS